MALSTDSLSKKVHSIRSYGISAVSVYFILPLAYFFATDIPEQWPILFRGWTLAILLAVCFRIYLFRKTNLSASLWLGLFYGNLFGLGATVGVLGLFLSFTTNLGTFSNLIFYMYVVSMASGAMITLSGEPRLVPYFLAVLLVPNLSGLLFMGAHRQEITLFFVCLGFAGLFLSLARRIAGWLRELDEQKSLVQSRDERLHQFMNSIPGLVSLFDKDLIYLDVNNRLLEVFEFERSKLIGLRLGDHNPTDPLVLAMAEFRNSQSNSHALETQISSRSGSLDFLVLFTKYEIQKETLYSILSLDVTAIKQQERNLEAQKLNLLQNEKMISLGEMAGSIAHEVNNPLAIIAGKVQVLSSRQEKGKLQPEFLVEGLEIILNTAFRIKEIIDSLKLLAQDSRLGPLASHKISEIILPVVNILHSKLDNSHVKLTIEHENPDLLVKCGLVEMGQVLTNLFVNSIFAIESLPEKWIHIRTFRRDDQRLMIEFKDSGPGIPPEVLAKLFTPFFTTKGPVLGTGIGLSLSRQLLQKQDGELNYDATTGHTTFVMSLVLFQSSSQTGKSAA